MFFERLSPFAAANDSNPVRKMQFNDNIKNDDMRKTKMQNLSLIKLTKEFITNNNFC